MTLYSTSKEAAAELWLESFDVFTNSLNELEAYLSSQSYIPDIQFPKTTHSSQGNNKG